MTEWVDDDFELQAEVQERIARDSDAAEIAEVAARRGAAPAGGRSERLYDDPDTEDRIGALAERHFKRAFGLPWDTRAKPNGDGGRDFVIEIPTGRITIDVKGSQLPFHLLVKVASMPRCADILVQIGVNKYDRCEMLGWDTREVMRWMPVAKFGKFPCHFRVCSQLRSVAQLAEIMAMRVRP